MALTRVSGRVVYTHGEDTPTPVTGDGVIEYVHATPGVIGEAVHGPDRHRIEYTGGVAGEAWLKAGMWRAYVYPSEGRSYTLHLGIPESGDVTLADVVGEVVPDGIVTRGEQGPPGAGAYETAVAEGFVGTEAEWLHSLQVEVSPLTVAVSPNGLLQLGGTGVIETADGLLAIVGFGEERSGLWSVNPIAAMQSAPLTSLWYDPADGLIYSGFGDWSTNEHTTGIVTHDPETGEARVAYYPRAGEGWPGYTKDGAYTEAVQSFFRLRDSIYSPHIDGGGYWEGCGYITNEGGTWHEEPLPGQALHVFSMAETSHGIWAAGSAFHENQEDAGPALWFRPDGGEWVIAYFEPVTQQSGARYLQIRVEDDRAWVNAYGGAAGDLPEPFVRGFRPDGSGGFDMATRAQGPGERVGDADYTWTHGLDKSITVGAHTYYAGPAGRITRELTP